MKASNDILRLYLGISAGADEEAVLRLLVDLGRQYAGAEEGSLLVLDRPTNRLVFAMTCGSGASEAVLRGQAVPLGRGLAGLAAVTGEVQIGATTFHGVHQRRRAKGAPAQPSAVLAAPMIVRTEVIGVLTAASFRPGCRFTEEHGEFYGRIAAVAGVVVDQQQRLAAMERLAGGRPRGRALTPRQRVQGRIVDSLTRLAAGEVSRLEQVAAVLAAFEPLCRGPRP